VNAFSVCNEAYFTDRITATKYNSKVYWFDKTVFVINLIRKS